MHGRQGLRPFKMDLNRLTVGSLGSTTGSRRRDLATSFNSSTALAPLCQTHTHTHPHVTWKAWRPHEFLPPASGNPSSIHAYYKNNNCNDNCKDAYPTLQRPPPARQSPPPADPLPPFASQLEMRALRTPCPPAHAREHPSPHVQLIRDASRRSRCSLSAWTATALHETRHMLCTLRLQKAWQGQHTSTVERRSASTRPTTRS
jgi:hypothetical protein